MPFGFLLLVVEDFSYTVPILTAILRPEIHNSIVPKHIDSFEVD
jgi:hypothetical protein